MWYHFIFKRTITPVKEQEKKLKEDVKTKAHIQVKRDSVSKVSKPSRKVIHIGKLGGNTYISETNYFDAVDFSKSSSSNFSGFGEGGSFGGGGASGSWDSGSSDSSSSDSGGGDD